MNAFRTITIPVDGDATLNDWDATNGTLSHLQEAVGGYVTVVSLASDLDMWLHDEGLLIGQPVNPVATAIAAAHGMTYQDYVGTAVFTGGADNEGETLPLTQEQAATLLTFVRRTRDRTPA
jgi:hypothetical protein